MTKKTDLEKMKKMFDKAGIEYEYKLGCQILLHAQDHKKVNGYSGFVCEFIFLKDGSLERVGIWE